MLCDGQAVRGLGRNRHAPCVARDGDSEALLVPEFDGTVVHVYASPDGTEPGHATATFSIKAGITHVQVGDGRWVDAERARRGDA